MVICMRKLDLRFIKTEELIIKNFKDLVFEKGFEKTYVQDICEKARISRNTFYAHYIDKYQLVDKLFEDFRKYANDTYKDEFNTEMLSYDFSNAVKWYIECIDENRENVMLLLKCDEYNFTNMLLETIIVNPINKFVNYFYNIIYFLVYLFLFLFVSILLIPFKYIYIL